MALKPAKQCVDIGIVVRDIERSLDFYCGVLGLEKLEEVPLPFGLMHRLRFGESFVKLVDPKTVPMAVPQGLMAALGIRYLTFAILNIDEACERFDRSGGTYEMEKQELLPGVVIAMLRDPDGNVVELVQRR
ncbi:MAG: VOC family protein [Parvibaculum sp.]|uniref:VOC family protein n=1 Tax=Parvibaculum sp. TaxID=2024848 RepID=UPI003C74D54F